MKKHWFIPAVCVCMSVALQGNAQTELGIKGGISIPNLTAGSSASPVSKGYSSRLGPDAAVFANFHLSRLFSIQPQVEYSSQGGKKNGTQAVPSGDGSSYVYANFKSTAKLNYLMIPVLARFNFPLGHNWLFYAAAGPFASFLLNANNVTSGSSQLYLDEQETQPVPGGEQSFNGKENIKPQLHTFNTGIDGFVGIAYQMGRSRVFIESGGNYGFLNIQKDAVDGKNHTGAAIVLAGYALRLKH